MKTVKTVGEFVKRKKACVTFLESIGVHELSVDALFVKIFERRQQCINAGYLCELDWMMRDILPDDHRTKLLNYIHRFEYVRDMRGAGELGIDFMQLQLPDEPILEYTRCHYIYALSVNTGHAKGDDKNALQALSYAKKLDEPSRSEALGAISFLQSRCFGNVDDKAMTIPAYREAGMYYLNAYEQLVAAHADYDQCLSIAQMIVNLRAWWGNYCGIETIDQSPISEELQQELIKTYGQVVLALSAT